MAKNLPLHAFYTNMTCPVLLSGIPTPCPGLVMCLVHKWLFIEVQQVIVQQLYHLGLEGCDSQAFHIDKRSCEFIHFVPACYSPCI